MNIYGSKNTANGFQALLSNTGSINGAFFGSSNTATGHSALFSNTTGFGNTAIGANALFSNLANENTAIGYRALFYNTSEQNTAIGYQAAVGSPQPPDTVFGSQNTVIGDDALAGNVSGERNTVIGAGAAPNITGIHDPNELAVGNWNVVLGGRNSLGTRAGENITTANNVICIGAGTIGPPSLEREDQIDDSCYIGNIVGEPVDPNQSIPVMIDGNAKLGTQSSSLRFKKEIRPMDQASEAILALKPVSFQYKSDSKGTQRFGLVAEEVAKVNPDLVVRDRKGEIYSVRYDSVNAMLLNEFLKEHKTVQAQGATIAELKKEVATLSTTVKEQAAQIQKVSAQLELSKPEPQTVLNNH
jgi:hypothetical protein